MASQSETLALIQSLLKIKNIATTVPTNEFGQMTTATTNTTSTTLVALSPSTASSLSNLQLLQHATNLANPPAPYPTDFILTLPESRNSSFPNSVNTPCTTTTHTTISSPEFLPFQEQTVPASGQVPMHQHYLSSKINKILVTVIFQLIIQLHHSVITHMTHLNWRKN